MSVLLRDKPKIIQFKQLINFYSRFSTCIVLTAFWT